MRVDYTGPAADLSEQATSAGWFPLFTSWLAAAVQAGVSEPNAMVLGTVDSEGVPATRTVLCKGLTPRGITFFTNYSSDKGRHLRAHPVASATFVWPSIARQVTFRGDVSTLSAAESDEYWSARPRGARLGAWASEQSAPIESREALDAQLSEVEARFADVEDIPRPEGWGGFELRPRSVEFWQGRTSRLHDRIRLVKAPGIGKSAETWHAVRLQP